MLHKEDFAVIKTLNQRGVYLKDIAAELGVHPRTVRRARRPGRSAPEPYPPARISILARRRPKRAGKWRGKP